MKLFSRIKEKAADSLADLIGRNSIATPKAQGMDVYKPKVIAKNLENAGTNALLGGAAVGAIPMAGASVLFQRARATKNLVNEATKIPRQQISKLNKNPLLDNPIADAIKNYGKNFAEQWGQGYQQINSAPSLITNDYQQLREAMNHYPLSKPENMITASMGLTSPLQTASKPIQAFRAVDSNNNKALLGIGKYADKSRQAVARYGTNIQKTQIDPNLKLLKLKSGLDYDDMVVNAMKDNPERTNQVLKQMGQEKGMGQIITDYVKKLGYQGVDGTELGFGIATYDDVVTLPKGQTISQLQTSTQHLLLTEFDEAVKAGNRKQAEVVVNKIQNTPELKGYKTSIKTLLDQALPDTPPKGVGGVDEVIKKPIKIFRAEDSNTGVSSTANGQYWAESEKLARQYGDQIATTEIPKGSKVLNFDVVKNNPKQTIVPKDVIIDPAKFGEWAKNNGYDFIKNTNTKGVEYVRLSNKVGDWIFDSGGAIPGEPLAWNKKFGVLDQLDEAGEATGKFELMDNKGNAKGVFNSVQEAIDSISQPPKGVGVSKLFRR